MNNTIYSALLFLLLCGFAIYDIRHKRVPNSALVLSLPIFLVYPFVLGYAEPISMFTEAVFGAVMGFGVLLTAALLSSGGAGVGGGDIKLAAAMGFAYGPFGILAILLCASVLCIPFAVFFQKKRPTKTGSLPFVPFLAVGSFVLTVIPIIY